MRRARPATLTATIGATLLAIATASPSAADDVRSAQWPLTAFRAQSRVWPLSTGAGVVVAVIDNGIRASHQDLTGQLLPGKDFVHGGNGWTDYSQDGHGTGMASLIAGHGHGPNDSEGVKGLAPGAKILPLTIDVSSTTDGQAQTAKAIRYAVDHGAAVIDMSFGGPAESPDEQSAIAYAEQHNVVLVAAAGNDSAPALDYPAGYPGVVAVSGVDSDGKSASDSDYGPDVVLAGPDTGVVAASATSDTAYLRADGTSSATAYVAAEAALVKAKYPDLTAGQIINRMVKSAINPTGRGRDEHFGFGIMRPDAALSFTIPAGPSRGPLTAPTSAQGSPLAAPTDTASSAGNSTSALITACGGLAALAVAITAGFFFRSRRRTGRGA